MIAFESMLVPAAQKAGMAVPPDELLDAGDETGPAYDREQFPHFFVYASVQLGRPIQWGNHWRNAEIIAAIPDAEIRTVTPEQLDAMGFVP